MTNPLKINYTITSELVSVFIKGNIFVVKKNDPRYEVVIESLSLGDFNLVNKLVDPTVALNLTKLTIKDNLFFWDGIELPENFYMIFVYLVPKKRSILPYLHFVIDNINNPWIKQYIYMLVRCRESIIPYDMTGRFFVTRSLQLAIQYKEILKHVADDRIDDIVESIYFDYLENIFGKGMLSFLKKEERLDISHLIYLYDVIKSMEYSTEDIYWCYKKILPYIEKINFQDLISSFKTLKKFKNWVEKSNYSEMKEVSDFLRIDGIQELKNEFFAQSGSFSQVLRLIMDAFSKINFKSQMVYFKKPIGLKYFDYTFVRKNIRYDIHFAKSNYDLYCWGLMFHNCAAGYSDSIVSGNRLVFMIEIDGNKLIIGELSARKRDGFVGKVGDKTIVKKVFDHWHVNQFKLGYNIETNNYKDDVVKLLKSLGLNIKYNKVIAE